MALVAGCGGGSDPGGGRLSTVEFRAQADAICEQANAKIVSLGSEAAGGSPQAFVRGVERGLEAVSIELTALGQLQPPAEMASTFASALDRLDRRQVIVRRLRERYARDAAAELASDVELAERAIAAARTKAKSLGLTECFDEDLSQTSAAPLTPVAP